MLKSIGEKRSIKAQKYITGAKDEFKKYIPRDKIENITVNSNVEIDGIFDMSGMVATVSPTGKEKSFGYTAKIRVDEKGKCTLEGLEVRD